MTRYELLTFLHVGSAIIWLGAGFLIAVLVLGAERSGDKAKEAGYHQDVGWLAPILFIPASLSTLIFGILLVIDGDWGFDQLWINIALIGWLVSFLTGILYFKPEGPKIGQMMAERGLDDPEAGRRLRTLNIVDRLQLLILFTVLADMVIKPVSGDTAVLVVGAGILLTASAITAASISRGGAPEAPKPV